MANAPFPVVEALMTAPVCPSQSVTLYFPLPSCALVGLGSATHMAPLLGACWPVIALDGLSHGTNLKALWDIPSC